MADWNSNVLQSARLRWLGDLALIEDLLPKASTVVELGAIPPLLTATLSRLGYEVIGIDIAPDRYTRVIRDLGLDVRPANFETEPIPVETEAADLVLCNEVFEHLRIDLPATFAEVHRVLRPGGILLLTTPNLLSLRGIVNLLVHRRAGSSARPEVEFSKLVTVGHMGHVREYTATEVTSFLEASGFDVIGIYRRRTGSSRLITRVVPSLLQHFTVCATRR